MQLPGLGVALGALHDGASGAEAGVTAVACGIAASLLLLTPWPRVDTVLVTALALPAIALAPGPPLAALPVAITLVRATLADAAAWVWSTLAGTVAVGIVVASMGGAHSGAVRLLVVTVLLCLVTGGSAAARARRERFKSMTQQLAARHRSEAEEERLRIARDLHDVLGHSLSQISVQAGMGLHLFDDDPERARESLRSIRETSVAALDEVRGVLGVLRGEGGAAGSERAQTPADQAPRTPAPTFDALPGLCADVRATGLEIALRGNVFDATGGLSRGAGAVPQPVQTAAFRIVQESSTNARRHSPGAPIVVVIDTAPGEVRIEVVNARPDPTWPSESASSHGPGHGIAGMRERVAVFGGTLLTDTTPDGGFMVRARIPYRPLVKPHAPEEAET